MRSLFALINPEIGGPETSRMRIKMTARLLVITVVLTISGPALAGSVWIPGVGGGGGSVIPVKSMTEKKFETVIRQQYDFSCGSAALATLLTYHYEDPINEQIAFNFMYEHGDQEKIQQYGFSLLDMKNYLANHGYDSDGFEAPLDALADASVPAITLLNVGGYRHFVVIKGVTSEKVLVGDPALGLKAYARDKFEAMWENGILFIITSKSESGESNFNQASAWQAFPRTPFGSAVGHESLGSLTISIPRPNEF